jgi:uncharacterized protein YjiS (DUF1127 family)
VLDDVHRKLRRTRRDLDRLRGELAAFDARVGRGLVIVGAFDQIRVSLPQEPDPEWSLDVGAIAYQLRSTLDRLVAGAFVQAGGDVAEHRGQFPIEVSEARYRKVQGGTSYRDRSLAGLAEGTRLVVDSLQPFSEPRHPLALLQTISNWDRHRDGHPAFAAARDGQCFVYSPAQGLAGTFHIPLARRQVHDGEDLLAGEGLGEAFERARALYGDMRMEDPDAGMELLFRIGVSFGRDRVMFFEIEQIVEFVEFVVVPALAPQVAHD